MRPDRRSARRRRAGRCRGRSWAQSDLFAETRAPRRRRRRAPPNSADARRREGKRIGRPGSCQPCAASPAPARWGPSRRRGKARAPRCAEVGALVESDQAAHRGAIGLGRHRAHDVDRQRTSGRIGGRPDHALHHAGAPDRPWSCRHRADPACRRRISSGNRRRRCRRPGWCRPAPLRHSRRAGGAASSARSCRPSSGRRATGRCRPARRCTPRHPRPGSRSPWLQPVAAHRIPAGPGARARSGGREARHLQRPDAAAPPMPCTKTTAWPSRSPAGMRAPRAAQRCHCRACLEAHIAFDATTPALVTAACATRWLSILLEAHDDTVVLSW